MSQPQRDRTDALFLPCPLLLLIGLPGSGKSTIAQLLQALSPDMGLISTDQIRADLFGDAAIQGPWPLIWQAVEVQFQKAVLHIQQERQSGVIYDATNAARRQRRRVIALAQQVGFTEITGLWFDTPLPLCLARNQARSRQVPVEIIAKMERQLQGAPPDLDEGFDRILQCTIQAPPAPAAAALQVLLSHLN